MNMNSYYVWRCWHDRYYQGVEFFLKNGADVNFPDGRGQPLLNSVLGWSDMTMVKLCLDWKADVNIKDGEGITPLMVAAEHGNIEAIELLVAKGADINAQTSRGQTVLMAALTNKFVSGIASRLETIKILLQLGADMDITTSNGYTVLSYAEDDVLEYLQALIVQREQGELDGMVKGITSPEPTVI